MAPGTGDENKNDPLTFTPSSSPHAFMAEYEDVQPISPFN